jgi:hypothetical protein
MEVKKIIQLSRLIEIFHIKNRDVPIISFNGTSLFIDDLLIIILLVILLSEKNDDFVLIIILFLLTIQ